LPWTAPKTWSVGETLTASNFNTHIRDNMNAVLSYRKMKAADETVNTSATLQDDNDLFFSGLVGESWGVTVALNVNSGTTPDFKTNWNKPAGATAKHATFYSNPTASQPWTSSDLVFATDATEQLIVIYAAIVIGGTAGTVTFQWAQNTSNASNTIVRAGSFMVAERMN
jgi:hypothetical protein